MAREKKPVHKVQMTEGKRDIIRKLIEEYDIETATDIQEALKDLLGGTIKEMMEAEMDNHLGYGKSERSDSDDYRNGYKSKRINSSYGNMLVRPHSNNHMVILSSAGLLAYITKYLSFVNFFTVYNCKFALSVYFKAGEWCIFTF